MQAVQPALDKLRQRNASIKSFEDKIGLNRDRAAARWDQAGQAWELSRTSVDTAPSEHDPLDWIQPSADQMAELRQRVRELPPLLDQQIRWCADCKVMFDADWRVCPRCGSGPSVRPLRSLISAECVRCRRLDLPKHLLTDAYCALHGLELEYRLFL